MKKRKEKKSDLPLKRVISNDWFALRLLWQACPGKVIYVSATNLSGAVMPVVSLFFLRFAVNSAQNGDSFQSVVKWLLLLCAVNVFQGILSVLTKRLYSAHFDAMTDKRLKRLLLTKTAECDLACYEDPEFYDKYTRAASEGSSRCSDVLQTLISCVSSLIRLFGYGSLILTADAFLFLFLIFPLIQMLFGKKEEKINYEASRAEDPIKRRFNYPTRTLYQSEYAKELRTTHVIRPILARFHESFDDLTKLKRTYGRRKILMGIISDSFTNFTQYYLNYCYLAWKTLVDKSMLVGDCFIAVTAIFSIQGALYGMNYYMMSLYRHALFIENLRQFMDSRPAIGKNQDGPAAHSGDIVLRDVSFRYRGAEQDTIRHLSLTIRRGEKIAIVGQNGAGKTTLVKLLLRLYDVDGGSITVDGADIRTLQLDSYRDLYATVLQDYHHFSLSVAENVLLRGEKEGDAGKVADALKKSGAYEFVMALPNKLDTTLYREFDDNGFVPSGGQDQKLAIAHVYSKGSPIIILDEPSSALDPISEHEMYETMMQACRDRTVIFISHRMSSAVAADRVVFMEQGEIAEVGTHKELMELNGKYSALFQIQAAGYAEKKIGEEGI